MSTLVRTADELASVCAAIAAGPRCAVDTEFHAEGRLVPQLLLVQVALDGAAYLVDPLAVDLTPLGDALDQTLVLVHGGRFDLALLERATGLMPSRLFDTQQAAGLLGHGFPRGLDQLTRDLLGVGLDKGVALSDWSRRPLSEDQLHYAADDAVVLLRLHDLMAPDLEARGRLHWTAELAQELVLEARTLFDQRQAWTTWDIARRLSEDDKRALHTLMCWRHEVAHQTDKPAYSILSDGLALEIARRRPKSLGQLAENRRIPRGLVQRHGAAILSALAHPVEPPRIPPEENAVLEAVLRALAAILARDHGIAAELSVPPQTVRAIAQEGPSALHGWRRAAIGDTIDNFFRGRVGIAIRGEIATISSLPS